MKVTSLLDKESAPAARHTDGALAEFSKRKKMRVPAQPDNGPPPLQFILMNTVHVQCPAGNKASRGITKKLR
jgi:hypothetical protein